MFEGGESVWPRISGRRGRFPPTILHVGKLSCIWYKNLSEVLFVSSQFMRFTDGRADGCQYRITDNAVRLKWNLNEYFVIVKHLS